MSRAVNEELQKLYDANIPVYSISRLDTINSCLYNAYLSYIEHDRGFDNAYSYLGGKVHEVLEGIMNGKNTKDDILTAVEEEVEDMKIAGIAFKDAAFEENWVRNMKHFAAHYEKPVGKFLTEQFFLYKTTKGHYLQGYIDLMQIHDDGTISICDYKTSAMYSPAAMKEHGRQLLLYAMGMQQQGYKVRKICWNFLKYCEVTFEGYKTSTSKNRSTIVKNIERRKVASELIRHVRRDLIGAGYDNFDTSAYLDEFCESNDFSVLPDEIAERYTIKPLIVEYELSDEMIEECENYLNDTIEKWESLSGNIEDYPPMNFLSQNKDGKTMVNFFCTQICGHKNCQYVADWINQNEF